MITAKPCECPKCGEHFDSISAMRRHRAEIHGPGKNIAHPYTWICHQCEIAFRTSRALQLHRTLSHIPYENKRYYTIGKKCEWRCKYCNCMCDTRSELFNHYKECGVKTKLPVDSKGRVIVSDRLKRAVETRRTRQAEGKYKPHPISDLTRKKLSDARKKYLATHRVNYNWKGPLNNRSYAEQYFYDIVDKRCTGNIEWRNNLRVGLYRLDFANMDSKVYFEVDGEQHYDEYGLLHDEIRTKKLSDCGWFLMARIRWKSFLHMNTTEQNEYIDRLISGFMSSETNLLPALPEVPVEVVKKRNYPAHRKPSILPSVTKKQQRQVEHQKKVDDARHKGLLRKDGRINGLGIPLDEWDRRKNLIMNCGVDLMKFGWKAKVMEQTGLTIRILADTISRFPGAFAGKCYCRQSPT